MPKTFQYQAKAEPLVTLPNETAVDQLTATLVSVVDPPRPVRRQPWAPTAGSMPGFPVPDRVGPTADEAVVWARVAELPRPARRQAWASPSVGPILPVSGRVDPAADAAVVYSRNAEYPRPPKRVPQPGGVTPPDVSGDRPVYGWQRALPVLPTRRRPAAPPTPHTGPLTYPAVTPSAWLRPTDLPTRTRRRLLDAVGRPPPDRFVPPIPRVEGGWPGPMRRRRQTLEGIAAPLRIPVPPFFGAENVRPAPMRRITSQSCSPSAPLFPPRPPFFQAEAQLPRPKARPRFEPAERRFDAIGPAVPALVWFVQHHLPVMLRRRHPEWLVAASDLDRSNLLPDDRMEDGRTDDGESVTGG